MKRKDFPLTHEFEDFILILGDKSTDLFDYYDEDEMYGLKRTEAASYKETKKDAYIAGLANYAPDESKPFVFLNTNRLSLTDEVSDMGLIMHELMHMSLLLHDWDVKDQEEEMVTWHEEMAYDVYPIIKKLLKGKTKLNESDDRIDDDIKYLINDEVIELIKYPTITYIRVDDLMGIFPDTHFIEIIGVLEKLGYGYIVSDHYFGTDIFKVNGREHNIYGPSKISDTQKFWFINGRFVASKYMNYPIQIENKELWEKYFAKVPLNEAVAHSERAISDLKFLLDNDLVEMEVFHYKNGPAHGERYLDGNLLMDLIPGLTKDTIEDLVLTYFMKYKDYYLYFVTDSNGAKYYRNHMGLHNYGGPAIISRNGLTKSWYINDNNIANSSYEVLNIFKNKEWKKYFADK